MIRFLSLLSLYFVALTATGQVTISGSVIDNDKAAVSSASIVLSTSEDGKDVLAYTTTNAQGIFTLNLKNEIALDSLWITARHISYSKLVKQVANKSQTIKLEFEAITNTLDDIILEAKKAITITGDTIVYDVASFQKPNDYTIGDVLERIPGITIDPNGKISYNDMPISHFYINGLDLLEGKYNLATNGIPADAVSDIEILRKHNHARIDQGKKDSNAVAINIRVKKKNVWFAGSKFDAGINRLLGLLEITPILIKEELQNLATLKANNTGLALGNESVRLTPESYQAQYIQAPYLEILEAPNVNGAAVSDKYWRDNNSFSLTNDVLKKTKKGDELKLAANFNRNDQAFSSSALNTFFFNDQQQQVSRVSNNKLLNTALGSTLVFERNKKDVFLKNTFLFYDFESQGNTNDILNGVNLLNDYKRTSSQLSNTLEYKHTLGKTLFSHVLVAQYIKENELAAINPAVFRDEIPSNLNDDLTAQTIAMNRFNIALNSSFDFKTNRLKWTITQTLSLSNESLNSQLAQSGSAVPIASVYPFSNDFRLNTLASSTVLNTNYELGKWSLNASTNLDVKNLDTRDLTNTVVQKNETFVFLQPSFNLNYKFNSKWSASFNSSYRTSISDFQNLYTGFILSNANSLGRNPGVVNTFRTINLDTSLNYANILNGTYVNIKPIYQRSSNDFTTVATLDNLGSTINDFTERNNIGNYYALNVQVTQRLLKGLLSKFSYSGSVFSTNQIFNETNIDFTNLNNNFSATLTYDNKTWYGVELSTNYLLGFSNVGQITTSNSNLTSALELSFYMNAKSRFNLGGELTSATLSNETTTNVNSVFFTSYYYQPSKKLKFKAELLNILNQERYTIVSNTANTNATYQFNLRPRQLVLGLTYTF